VIAGVSILADLFDKTTVAGEALQFLFESIFQPIVDQATNAAYVVEAFYLGFLIGALKLYIGLKPAIKAIAEFFGFEDTSLESLLAIVTKAGEYAAYVFAGFAVVFGVLAVAVALALVPVAAIAAAVYLLITAVIAAGAALLGIFVSAWQSVTAFFAGLDLVQVGTDIVLGLARGISGAASYVLSAITGVVGGAINAAKSLLGISSPSKVFADIGVNTGEGMTSGVEDGTADVQAAYKEMVSPDVALTAATTSGAALAEADASAASIPSAADAPSSGVSASESGGGGALRDFSNAMFNFYGVKDAEGAEQKFREMLLMADEELALMLGAGEAATT